MTGTEELTRLPARLGGRLCLDFVNTVDPRGPRGRDYLPGYVALIDWAGATEAVDRDVIDRARAAAATWQATEAYHEAISLRETLYRVLRASAERRQPDEADADALRAAVARLQSRRLLVTDGTAWRWAWSGGDPLRLPGWIILADAIDLLAGAGQADEADRANLRVCAGQDCGWLFVDTSKNHTRRWCSMSGCGNRSKTQRHYQRLRAKRASQLTDAEPA